jgi:acyl-CoA thioesterase I
MTFTRTGFVFLMIAWLVTPFSPARSESATNDATLYVLVMGDSLSAGYNLPPGTSFPDQLEDWLNNRGLTVRVINAGVSGDTSAAGRARLDWALASAPGGRPDLVIIEFGGNDVLRGIEPARTRDNIGAMIDALSQKNIPTLLAGMQAPPNMGDDYANEFRALYSDLAAEKEVALYPFFLDGVAAIPALNLADGMHPTVEGIGIIVARIGPLVASLIEN